MINWTAADRAFYEWLHVNGIETISLPMQREIFMAGWTAAMGSEQDGE